VLVSKARFATFNRARFARLYYIDQQIRAGKFPNTPKLARELEIEPRTVERDLELMRDRLGACIAYDHRQKGYYYTSADFQLPPLKLTEGEAVVLFLGQKLLAQCTGTPLENTIRSAFDKVCALLPASISVDFATFESAVSFNMAPLRGDENQVADTFQKLATAVQDRTTIWLEYFSATRNQATERHVDPYHLRYFQGAWYLIGYCHWRRKVRIFAIDRILSLQETNQTFTPIPGFSLQEFLTSSIGIEMDTTPQEVVIRFDSHQARWIRERQWHQSQRLEPQSDGSLLLYLTVSGLGEVKRWVLSFGSHAEVLLPLSLRQEVSAELIKAATFYNR